MTAKQPLPPGWEELREETTSLVPLADSNVLMAGGSRDRCTLVMLRGPTPGAVVPMEGTELVVGRGTEASARVEDEGLSRLHARVFSSNGEFFVEDLKSTNGTFLNGQPVLRPVRVADGDRVLVGRTTLLRVNIHDAFEQEATRRMYESAVRDSLTGVHNRRYLDERLRCEVAFAARHGTPLSLLLIDLDHFKRVNDTRGHAVGDEALRQVARVVSDMVRAEDLVARYGGEEFCIVARGTRERAALVLGERIREAIAGLRIAARQSSDEGEDTFRVTVSIGMATMHRECSPAPDSESLLALADEALYRAKDAGRNCCRVTPIRT